MKKNFVKFTAVCLIAVSISSCATLFGGPIGTCQKTKPCACAGQPARDIRVAALVLDFLLFWPGAIIDFATNAIYVPCKGSSAEKI